MTIKRNPEKYIKFFIYTVAIVLINIVGIGLFYRIDLTQNKMYSLSEASKKVVSTLSEPLTVKVFFTKNLPAPHNNTEQYLHDLLKEYALNANRHFNYRFYDVSPEAGDLDPEARENQKHANDYGIYPVQIQNVEKDEVKFTKAYMGMVLINGDLIEKIPTITNINKLEYSITSAIRKLNNKVSALLRLKEKITIKLYLSSSLKIVAPYIKLNDLDELPVRVKGIVDNLNGNHFGKLTYEYLDPSLDERLSSDLTKYQVISLKWPALNNGDIKPGQGAIGLVLTHNEKSVSIPLINVLRLPLIGTQYSLTDMGELEETISENIESLIDINEDIGYLASHGTLTAVPAQFMNTPQAQNQDNISNFKNLASQNYTFKNVDLKSETIPDTFNCLLIARPTENFTDYELFQIDQFLMRGKSLALFLDSFQIVEQTQQQMMMNQGPSFLPINTGLEKLLAHYGIGYEQSYVLDKNCFKQRIQQRFGGGERPIYFAPVIKNEKISHDPDFMKSIKGIITMKVSPLHLKDEAIENQEITATRLFSSSDESWELKGHIHLNPAMMHPPNSEDDYTSYPLAYLLEGRFSSYFSDKPIPEKSTDDANEETQNQEKQNAERPNTNFSEIKDEGSVIKKGKPGKIFLIASSELLKNNMFDEAGQSANATFLLNTIDALNGRSDTAIMRGKEQRFNPLNEASGSVKTGIKTFNIIGLPMLVILFGTAVWFGRLNRKKRIRMMFQK